MEVSKLPALHLGHRSESGDWFRVHRLQLRDICFRFLEETTTFPIHLHHLRDASGVVYSWH